MNASFSPKIRPNVRGDGQNAGGPVSGFRKDPRDLLAIVITFRDPQGINHIVNDLGVMNR
jgi:hypothetical protein